MKRHGFYGVGASHGAHRIHRKPGSIGACATPSRVFKGTKMAGRMGGERVTTQNLEVVKADAEAGVVLVQGAVPGPNGGVVLIRNAVEGRREGQPLMAKVKVTDMGGKGAGDVELDEAIFGIQPNVPVMHQVVTAQLAARRAGTQSTKTRAEVRGGGAKPWKQKGTGRGRQGSTRAPHWTGGGVALGPKPRCYEQKTPKKMVRLALRSALSDRAAERRRARDRRAGRSTRRRPSRPSPPSTPSAAARAARCSCSARATRSPGRASATSASRVHPILARELNAYDVLVADRVVFTRETLPSSEAKPAEAPVARPPSTINDAE